MNIRFLLVVILLLTAVATTGCSDYQVSPLASAARRGDAAGIADLIRRGASTEEGTGVNNWTPLQHAIDKNQAQAAFALIEAGRANPNLTTTDTTPLMMAARNGQEEIVRGLLKRGADPLRMNSKGESAIDLAVAASGGKCQAATVAALLAQAPQLARQARFLQACPGMPPRLSAL